MCHGVMELACQPLALPQLHLLRPTLACAHPESDGGPENDSKAQEARADHDVSRGGAVEQLPQDVAGNQQPDPHRDVSATVPPRERVGQQQHDRSRIEGAVVQPGHGWSDFS